MIDNPSSFLNRLGQAQNSTMPRPRFEKIGPFLTISTLQAYTVLTVVRCLADPTWIVLKTSDDKTGGKENPSVDMGLIGKRERVFLGFAVAFTMLSCAGIVLRIKDLARRFQPVFLLCSILQGYGNLSPRTTAGRIIFFILGIIGVSAIGYFIVSLRDAIIEQFEWRLNERFSKPAHLMRVHTRMSAKDLSFPMARYEEEMRVKAVVKRKMYVTLTTIGFGDLVPAEPASIEFWNVYVFVGLTIFAYVLSMSSESISSRIHLVDDATDEYDDGHVAWDQFGYPLTLTGMNHKGNSNENNPNIENLGDYYALLNRTRVVGLESLKWSQQQQVLNLQQPYSASGFQQQQNSGQQSLQSNQSSVDSHNQSIENLGQAQEPKGVDTTAQQQKGRSKRKGVMGRPLAISTKERKHMLQAEYYATHTRPTINSAKPSTTLPSPYPSSLSRTPSARYLDPYGAMSHLRFPLRRGMSIGSMSSGIPLSRRPSSHVTSPTGPAGTGHFHSAPSYVDAVHRYGPRGFILSDRSMGTTTPFIQDDIYAWPHPRSDDNCMTPITPSSRHRIPDLYLSPSWTRPGDSLQQAQRSNSSGSNRGTRGGGILPVHHPMERALPIDHGYKEHGVQYRKQRDDRIDATSTSRAQPVSHPLTLVHLPEDECRDANTFEHYERYRESERSRQSHSSDTTKGQGQGQASEPISSRDLSDLRLEIVGKRMEGLPPDELEDGTVWGPVSDRQPIEVTSSKGPSKPFERHKDRRGSRPIPSRIVTTLPGMTMATPRPANPFAGQNIGYLRLAVVGDSGVGKTSFARQFTETLPEVLSHDWDKVDENAEDYVRTDALVEKFSSTMMEIPWDNMDADDEVPARNLVFIDTPGYGSVVDAQTNFDMFLRYIGQTFEEKNKKISPFMDVSNNELMRSLVTGVGAHNFIDVCFYLIVHRLKPTDIEFMRLISEKANVVPIICKADTQSQKEVNELKVHVLKTLREQGVSIYTFRTDYERLIHMAESGQAGGPPFAVSNTHNKPATEDENDQISFAPAENELSLLRKLVLETQITNIRQFTVKKFINWRGKAIAQQNAHGHLPAQHTYYQAPPSQQYQFQQQQQQYHAQGQNTYQQLVK
ncbi:hypothetical protein BGW38_002808 [Lunasporangiospora selenospora]|uniref:Septin-type G domain-containing protein n=1 Tax=Lunasporangiospora selenospora TaxID=979761 RepID=A0A9P6KCN4_9FUNG|nr:hypothetical protein BGW38_002808 [Lunasporangiospora selenospora]